MKSWMLFAGLSVCASLAHAGEITFSNASTTANNSGGVTEQYTTVGTGGINGTWDPSLFVGSSSDWISFDTAGLFGCNSAHTQTVNKGDRVFFVLYH